MTPYSTASTSSTSSAITKRHTITTLFETSCTLWLISAAVELLLRRREFEPVECGGILARLLPFLKRGKLDRLFLLVSGRTANSKQIDGAARTQRPAVQSWKGWWFCEEVEARAREKRGWIIDLVSLFLCQILDSWRTCQRDHP